MNYAVRQAKIKWLCRRGMLELDLLLLRFVEEKLSHLSEAQLDTFEALLQQTDPQLLSWFMGYEKPSQKEFSELIELIRLQN